MDALLTETRELTGQLQEFLAQDNGAEIRRLAHTIKGSFRMFGESEALTLAEQLERLAKDDNLQEAPAALEELKAELDRVLPEIAAFVKGDLTVENS